THGWPCENSGCPHSPLCPWHKIRSPSLLRYLDHLEQPRTLPLRPVTRWHGGTKPRDRLARQKEARLTNSSPTIQAPRGQNRTQIRASPMDHMSSPCHEIPT